MSHSKNIFYAQSGGVTPVINATAAGVITKAEQFKSKISQVYMGHNGILGALKEEMYNGFHLSVQERKQLLQSPGGAFGSCRFKLPQQISDPIYRRILQVLAAHQIHYFLYNGGGDSQDSCLKIAQAAEKCGYEVNCIGLPKTIDNDLPVTDNCPGFGSTAKYIAISTQEIGLDVAAMADTSTKVFIFEVMGRHAGWLAASSAIGKFHPADSPHLILFPERIFRPKDFLRQVNQCVAKIGFCVVVAAEGICDNQHRFVSESANTDAFGHTQLGGVAALLANLVQTTLKMKTHYAVADYLQRSARHIASQVDLDQAFAVGQEGVRLAVEGQSKRMVTIQRKLTKSYRWQLSHTPLFRVANRERTVPNRFISADGYGITGLAKKYLTPLIAGEAYPDYQTGLPTYLRLKHSFVPKKLEPWNPVEK